MENIVYLAKAEFENSNKVKEEKTYIGATENEWKKGAIIINFVQNTVVTKTPQRCQCVTGRIKVKWTSPLKLFGEFIFKKSYM